MKNNNIILHSIEIENRDVTTKESINKEVVYNGYIVNFTVFINGSELSGRKRVAMPIGFATDLIDQISRDFTVKLA